MIGIKDDRASDMRWRAVLSGSLLIAFLCLNLPAIAQDCEPLKPIKPVDTQIRDKTEAQANTVLKSLLSGTIKNEYERIATNVSGDEVHKWDSFVYMVCTILRDSKMSSQEKLGQLSILIQLKGQAPPPAPPSPASQPHSSIPAIAKLAGIGSTQDAIRQKYLGGSYSPGNDGIVTYKYDAKISVPNPVSHAINIIAISYFDRNNIVNKTVWMMKHECGGSDSKEHKDGIFNLIADDLGLPTKHEEHMVDYKPSELGEYGAPAPPPDYHGHFQMTTYWFKSDDIQAKLLTGWPCVEEIILERI
jgi:hypothetical protein